MAGQISKAKKALSGRAAQLEAAERAASGGARVKKTQVKQASKPARTKTPARTSAQDAEVRKANKATASGISNRAAEQKRKREAFLAADAAKYKKKRVKLGATK